MQDQRIPGASSSGAPWPGSHQHEVQRRVLLELLTTPPPEGDELASLADGLGESRRDVEAAVDALVDTQLAQREGDVVRASVAALRFEALWPIGT
jgi:hypothetical protein